MDPEAWAYYYQQRFGMYPIWQGDNLLLYNPDTRLRLHPAPADRCGLQNQLAGRGVTPFPFGIPAGQPGVAPVAPAPSLFQRIGAGIRD